MSGRSKESGVQLQCRRDALAMHGGHPLCSARSALPACMQIAACSVTCHCCGDSGAYWQRLLHGLQCCLRRQRLQCSVRWLPSWCLGTAHMVLRHVLWLVDLRVFLSRGFV
jgi:hypothetical protein